jgi:hypothetical protein
LNGYLYLPTFKLTEVDAKEKTSLWEKEEFSTLLVRGIFSTLIPIDKSRHKGDLPVFGFVVDRVPSAHQLDANDESF